MKVKVVRTKKNKEIKKAIGRGIRQQIRAERLRQIVKKEFKELDKREKGLLLEWVLENEFERLRDILKNE